MPRNSRHSNREERRFAKFGPPTGHPAMPKTPAPSSEAPPAPPPDIPKHSVLEVIRLVNKRLDKYPTKIADLFKWGRKAIVGLEVGAPSAAGFLAVQVTEWAAAILCWFALGFVLLIKALSWQGFSSRKVLTGLSRTVFSLGAIGLSVFLCTWTVLKKPPDQVWTAFQNFHRSAPHTDTTPLLHVTGMQVAFNRSNTNQIVANIFIQNDGDDMELSSYNSNSLAVNTTPEDDSKHLQALWGEADALRKAKSASEFAVPAKEARWFTNFGVTYSKDQIDEFNQGKGTFYFLGYIVARHGTATKTLSYCGYVTGIDLNAIVECPSKGESASLVKEKLPDSPKISKPHKRKPTLEPCPNGYTILENVTAGKSEWDHAKTTGFVFDGPNPCVKIKGANSIDNDTGYEFKNGAKPKQ